MTTRPDKTGKASRPMRARMLSFVLATSTAIGATLLSPASAGAAIVERVVAIVGQDAILLTDLRERALPYLLRVYASVPEGPQRAANISQIYNFVLNTMVDERLEEDAARAAGIEVEDEQLEQAIAQAAAQNNITVTELLVEAKRTGLTEEQYRDELRRQLLQRTMMEVRLRGRINVTENDLRSAYRQLSIDERMAQTQSTSQLRIPAGTTKAQRAASRKWADQLYHAARTGVDFAQLIAQNAVDSGSGLRPPLAPQQEPTEIQRATVTLEVGEVSAPILLNGYWVILKVLERPPSELPPFADARAPIHERVYMEKMGKAREHWLKGLRRRTHVEIRL